MTNTVLFVAIAAGLALTVIAFAGGDYLYSAAFLLIVVFIIALGGRRA